jgi:hypothetical protein
LRSKEAYLKHSNKFCFGLMNNNEDADDVANFPHKKYPDVFAGNQTLVMHTNTKGEITKNALEKSTGGRPRGGLPPTARSVVLDRPRRALRVRFW